MTRHAAWLLLAITLGTSPALADDVACFDAHEAAQIARKHGALLRARGHLAICGQNRCPGSVQRDCVGWAVELAAQQPSYVVAVVGDDGADLVGASITVDGAEITRGSTAIEIDPGVHRLHVVVAGRAPVDQPFEMREGERGKRVVVAVPGPRTRPAETTRLRPLTYALGGVAAVALGSFIGFAVIGKTHEHAVADSCGDRCSDARVDGIRHLYLAADISLGISVVAAGALLATWLFLPASTRTKRPMKTASFAF